MALIHCKHNSKKDKFRSMFMLSVLRAMKQFSYIATITFFFFQNMITYVTADVLKVDRTKLIDHEYINILFEKMPSFDEIKSIYPDLNEYSILEFQVSAKKDTKLFCYQQHRETKPFTITYCLFNLKQKGCSNFNGSHICSILQDEQSYEYKIEKYNENILTGSLLMGKWVSFRYDRVEEVARDKTYYIVLYRSYNKEKKGISFKIKTINTDLSGVNQLIDQEKQDLINQYRFLNIPEYLDNVYGDGRKRRIILD